MRLSHRLTFATPALLISALLLLAIPSVAQAQTPTLVSPSATPMTEAQKAAMAEKVRQAFLHAWTGYRTYAWGHDALHPIAKTPEDWYAGSLLMTPVDALDTMLVMGLTKQANEARNLIDTKLNFDQDIVVRDFEINIRLLGSLLSCYEMTGDKRLLELADDLGRRMLPIFESPTGLPYVNVNLRTGAVSGTRADSATAGSMLLEFGVLSKLTGKQIYYDRAKRAVVALYNHRSPIGLVGSGIEVETGKWFDETAGIKGGIDSYYEYLLKCAILFHDPDCERMWLDSLAAINKYLADDRPSGLWYGRANMNSGLRTDPYYGALDAFFPAALALSGDIPRATRLEDSSYLMWNFAGIEPETFDYDKMKIISPEWPLRPEIVESAYYLYHYTGDPKYLAMGQTFYNAIMRYCRTDAGFAAMADVRTKEKSDHMESFFFAETLKYLYLLYAPKTALNFDAVIFNTEAHPLRRDMKVATH